DSAILRARLSRWRTVVADGDAARFRRYLAWSGLDETMARRAVAPPQRGGVDPEWLAVLDLACGSCRADPPAPRGRANADDRATLPFGELIEPFVAAVRRLLRSEAAPHDAALTDGAHGDLESALRGRLARLADRSFFAEFAAFRACEWSGGRRHAS